MKWIIAITLALVGVASFARADGEWGDPQDDRCCVKGYASASSQPCYQPCQINPACWQQQPLYQWTPGRCITSTATSCVMGSPLINMPTWVCNAVECEEPWPPGTSRCLYVPSGTVPVNAPDCGGFVCP